MFESGYNIVMPIFFRFSIQLWLKKSIFQLLIFNRFNIDQLKSPLEKLKNQIIRSIKMWKSIWKIYQNHS